MILPFLAKVSSERPFLPFTDCMDFFVPYSCARPPGSGAHIPRVYDGDNNDHDAAGAAGAARTARGWKCLIYAGFGQLDRNPELYLAQHLVELFAAGTVLEVGGDGLKPQQCRGLNRPYQ